MQKKIKIMHACKKQKGTSRDNPNRQTVCRERERERETETETETETLMLISATKQNYTISSGGKSSYFFNVVSTTSYGKKIPLMRGLFLSVAS